MNTNNTVPLVMIALEIGADADALAVKLADAVSTDTAGLRCVSTDTAHRITTAHHAALQAEREQRRRERAEERQRPRPVRRGIPANPGSTAIADMIGADQR